MAFVSLGCPKNLVASERMLGLLTSRGLAVTDDLRQADAIVVNTCGFIEAARQESLREIREAAELKRTGRCRRLVVAGCLVQRDRNRLLQEVPEIDCLVGVFDRERIVEAVCRPAMQEQPQLFLGKYHDLAGYLAGCRRSSPTCRHARHAQAPLFEDDRARFRLTPRHYAYLRITDGCSHGCSFCTIPSIRGPMRSKPVEQIMEELQELAADGAVEVILIGQDSSSYGKDIGYRPGLAGLLRRLQRSSPPQIRWVRLMYAHPSFFTDELIRTLADCQRLVKYVDLPLQHINDQILARMRRGVTRSQIESLLTKLRKLVPGIAIRTTFITGCPGETDRQHEELLRFIEDFKFDMLGVFTYSPEPGTPMARMEGQLPERVKQRRLRELMLAQQKVAFEKARSTVGRTLEVLIDHPPARKGLAWTARCYCQAPEIDPVTLVQGTGLRAGQFVRVRITGSRGYDLLASPTTLHHSSPPASSSD